VIVLLAVIAVFIYFRRKPGRESGKRAPERSHDPKTELDGESLLQEVSGNWMPPEMHSRVGAELEGSWEGNEAPAARSPDAYQYSSLYLIGISPGFLHLHLFLWRSIGPNPEQIYGNERFRARQDHDTCLVKPTLHGRK
jgi:hypothetical protein